MMTLSEQLDALMLIEDNGDRWAALVALMGQKHARRYWIGFFHALDIVAQEAEHKRLMNLLGVAR